MAAQILNPFRGPSKIYLKEYSSVSPVSSNSVSWSGWTDLGYQYQGPKGIIITTKTEVEELTVEGFSAPIQRNILGESISVSVDILKTTWAKIAAYGLAGAKSTPAAVVGTNPNLYQVGGKNYLTELSLGIEGVNDLGYASVLWVPKCTINAEASLNFKKSQKDNFVNFTFDGLADTSLADGAQLYSIYEITGVAAIGPETVI